jgi:hypothetical protein
VRPKSWVKSAPSTAVAALLAVLCSETTTSAHCLDRLWTPLTSDQDRQYDVEHDEVKNGKSLSCEAFLRPSELNRSLNALKLAVSGNPLEINNASIYRDLVVNYTYLIGSTKRKQIHRHYYRLRSVRSHFGEIFSHPIRDLIVNSKLEDLDPMPTGAMLGLGAIWWKAEIDPKSQGPHAVLYSINP